MGCTVLPEWSPPVVSPLPHDLPRVHGHFQVERSRCWCMRCALCSCSKRGEGERQLPAGKQVIPSRRNKAYVIFSGLGSSFSTGKPLWLSKSLQSEVVQACMDETLFSDHLLPGRAVVHPFLQPGARDISTFPRVLTSPLAPASHGLHTNLARQESGTATPACEGCAPSPGRRGLRGVTTRLSVARPVTVTTLSRMHVGVQAPPYLPKFKLLSSHATSREPRAAAASVPLGVGTTLHRNTPKVSQPFSSCLFLLRGLSQFS